PVERMSKLVKQGSHFIEGQQGRCGRCWLGKVANDRYMWPLLTCRRFFLASEACHPGAVSFAGTRKKIGIEHGHMVAGFIFYLISFYIWVIYWNVRIGDK